MLEGCVLKRYVFGACQKQREGLGNSVGHVSREEAVALDALCVSLQFLELVLAPFLVVACHLISNLI